MSAIDKPIVIVGTGLAGYTLAREFRKLDSTTPLLLISADDGGFYSKPMLSNAFAQKRLPAQLATQSAAQMATQLNATVLTHTRISAIDSAQRLVIANGATVDYDKLVLAVGAQPIRLPLAGDAADQVLSVNHLEDYSAFRARLETVAGASPARVAILGAGLIGCEFADDLRGAGHAVTLIDRNDLPLAALAAPALAQGLRDALLERGVTLKLGVTATRVDHDAQALRVTLSDDSSCIADIVLSAVGLRPNLTLAQAAGLQTVRGIVVDSFGQTSAPGIYALGDCAEYTDDNQQTQVLPYIAPLMTAARAIARTLSGTLTAIDLKAAPVLVKTPSYPLALMPPRIGHVGEWRLHTEGKHTVWRFHDEQQILHGFGVAYHDAGIRQLLMTALGTTTVTA